MQIFLGDVMTNFSNIDPGNTFTYEGTLYLKTTEVGIKKDESPKDKIMNKDKYNAVVLSSGKMVWINENAQVMQIELAVIDMKEYEIFMNQ